MERKPAASQIETSACMSHVVAVCPQSVWRYVIKPDMFACSSKTFLDVSDGAAIDMQNIAHIGSALSRAPQVQQQLRRDRDHSALLLSPVAAGDLKVDEAANQINLRPTKRKIASLRLPV